MGPPAEKQASRALLMKQDVGGGPHPGACVGVGPCHTATPAKTRRGSTQGIRTRQHTLHHSRGGLLVARCRLCDAWMGMPVVRASAPRRAESGSKVLKSVKTCRPVARATRSAEAGPRSVWAVSLGSSREGALLLCPQVLGFCAAPSLTVSLPSLSWGGFPMFFVLIFY